MKNWARYLQNIAIRWQAIEKQVEHLPEDQSTQVIFTLASQPSILLLAHYPLRPKSQITWLFLPLPLSNSGRGK